MRPATAPLRSVRKARRVSKHLVNKNLCAKGLTRMTGVNNSKAEVGILIKLLKTYVHSL